jgi:subfamily B ATP-binding cassette protein MsbA
MAPDCSQPGQQQGSKSVPRAEPAVPLLPERLTLPIPPITRWLPRRILNRVLQPLISQEPAAKLIRHTAHEKRGLLALNTCSNLLQAFSEGATLGVVYLAVETLSAPTAEPFNWTNTPILSRLPGLEALFSSLPPSGSFMLLLGLAVLLQVLQGLATYTSSLSMGFFTAHCIAMVKGRIHSQVLSFSFPCASGFKVGDLTNHAASGPPAVQCQIGAISGLIIGVLMAVSYIVVLISISPWLLLAAGSMGSVITLIQRNMLPRISSGSRKLNAVEVSISQQITEDFQALRLLHSSGQLEAADSNLLGRMVEFERLQRAQVRNVSIVGPISSLLPMLAIALIACFSVLLFGGRSAGVLASLVTFVLALQRLNQRMSNIAGNFNALADNAGKLDRLNKILSPDGKQFRRLGGTPFARLERGIRFEDVVLQYSPELQPALGGISLTMAKGKMLALVGPSGAGKSSIADLLTGLYAPTAGKIWVDDRPLNQLELSGWQQRLGVVSQDTFLFNATIAENIAFGTPGVNQAQIQAACQAAQAAGFIERLPKGYDTMVGERGYRLSGGQRQRLSLARAILRDPELLILDEATSALDSQSERLVQEAIERFGRDHTMLVIAHRLSTIVRADQILVLESGRIIQRGNHSSLLAEGGRYAQLWDQQTSYSQSTLP